MEPYWANMLASIIGTVIVGSFGVFITMKVLVGKLSVRTKNVQGWLKRLEERNVIEHEKITGTLTKVSNSLIGHKAACEVLRDSRDKEFKRKDKNSY